VGGQNLGVWQVIIKEMLSSVLLTAAEGAYTLIKSNPWYMAANTLAEVR
jgi:hypothetical protein